MARQESAVSKLRGEESVRNVVAVLANKEFFPWIGEIEETQAWGDDDVKLKTDLIVTVDDEMLENVGCIDQLRVQVKSSWKELTAVGQHGFLLCDLTPAKWKELQLIVLVGQQSIEAITASFIVQVMNHLGIWGDEGRMWSFMRDTQTDALRRILGRYLAQDLVARDWNGILNYVQGHGVIEEAWLGKSKVKFF